VSGVYGLVHEFAVEVFINLAQRPPNFRGSGNDLKLTRAATTRALVPSLSQLKRTALAIIALILRNKANAGIWSLQSMSSDPSTTAAARNPGSINFAYPDSRSL
jgi:hypothetical protein